MDAETWKPPFCSADIEGMACPACGDESVQVRAHDIYHDGDTCEAYCEACHATLTVDASVTIAFDSPTVVKGHDDGR